VRDEKRASQSSEDGEAEDRNRPLPKKEELDSSAFLQKRKSRESQNSSADYLLQEVLLKPAEELTKEDLPRSAEDKPAENKPAENKTAEAKIEEWAEPQKE